MNLGGLNNQLSKLQAICDQTPLNYWNPCPPQERFLRDNSKIKLLRGGNQIGKSAAGIVELLGRCLGNHPYLPVKKPPIIAWLIVHSYDQSKTIMQKIWDMADKRTIQTEFVIGRGFRSSGAPVIVFKNGSICRIKTTQQAQGGRGTMGLASGSVDFILVDEPPPQHVVGELFARVSRTRGRIAITMTPVGVPCDFIKKMVDDGLISETVAPLTEQNLTPKGCRPLLSSEEIDAITMNYLPIDRAARVSGDWVAGIPEGRIFDLFDDEHISARPCPQNGEFLFGIGIDHGSDAGSQCAVLVAVDISDKKDPFLYVLDEVVAGAAPAEVHARSILAMIERNNLKPGHINRWTGDRAHGGNQFGGKMSNRMIMAAFSHLLGYDTKRLPFSIRTAHKPRFSVYYTCSAIHAKMAKKRFSIHPRCTGLIKSFKFWALKKNGWLDTLSEHKHLIDACRYACMPLLSQAYAAPLHSKIRIR